MEWIWVIDEWYSGMGKREQTEYQQWMILYLNEEKKRFNYFIDVSDNEWNDA